MSRLHTHAESHAASRIGWLRAAVLGANDGIVSTASLIVGVAVSDAGRSSILIAGTAGLFAGAMSMAAGEYVSVSSQADTEKADLAREKRELAQQPDLEREELTRIYEARGVARSIAESVAEQMTLHDALVTHARDELGLSETMTARPLQAALASALTFSAADRGPALTCISVGACRRRRLTCLPRSAWRAGCAGRRRSARPVRLASYVLGGVGNGSHSRRRPDVWRCGRLGTLQEISSISSCCIAPDR